MIKLYLIGAAILMLLGVVAYLKIKWNRMVKKISSLKEENQTLQENNETLTTENNQLQHAIHAFEELEGNLGELERKYKDKKDEYEKNTAGNDAAASCSAFNKLSND